MNNGPSLKHEERNILRGFQYTSYHCCAISHIYWQGHQDKPG